MDIKIRHLYEMAVITAFTAAPRQDPTDSAKESGLAPSSQDPPQQVAYQINQNQHRTPTIASWSFPTDQGDHLWASSSSLNAPVNVAGQLWSVQNAPVNVVGQPLSVQNAPVNVAWQPWSVQNAPSVSNFTSGESISSWATDNWSRESLASHESIADPSYSQNYVSCASSLQYIDSGFIDHEFVHDAMTLYSGPINPGDIWQDRVTFLPGPIDPDDLWRSDNSATALAYSGITNEGMQHGNFDVMLERVAQGIHSLDAKPTDVTQWQNMAPVCGMYGDTIGTYQTVSNGFEDVEIVLEPEHPVCGVSSDVQFETDRYADSVTDSGQVSRASSLTSLVATCGDVSDDNMADMESCESIKEQRLKMFTRKLNTSAKRDKNINRRNPSTQERSKTNTSAHINTRKIRQQPDSYRSTSGCSDSMASYSLSSDSETDLKSEMTTMNFAEWTRLKREKIQSAPSAIPSIEVSNLSVSEKDLTSNINTMNFAEWTRLKREKLQSAPSAIPSTEASISSASKPNVSRNSQMGFDPSSAGGPHIDHNPHELTFCDSGIDSTRNMTHPWDSGIDSTRNMTHLWDTSSNMSNNTSDGFTYKHYSEGTYSTEQPHNIYPTQHPGFMYPTEHPGYIYPTEYPGYIYPTEHLDYIHPTEHPQYIYPTCDSLSACCTNDNAKLPAQERPPYSCSLDHGSEFIPIQDLDVRKLPPGYRGWKQLKTILEISHRTVKLRVNKQFKSAQLDNVSSEGKPSIIGQDASEEPVLEHYGTGFACHVDKETIIIRTHSELVGTSTEASNTEVIFAMTFPNGSRNHQISCTGVSDGFSSNDHSQTTRFMCRTPPDLISYLHLFKDVPVTRKTSLFNDSSYFTDSSPDTSTSGRDELENDQKDITWQRDMENFSEVSLDAGVSSQTGVCGHPLTGHNSSSSLYSHVLANRNEQSVQLTKQTSGCFEEDSLKNNSSQQTHDGPWVNISADYEHKAGDSFIVLTNTFMSPINEFILPDDTKIINKPSVPPQQAFESHKAHHINGFNSNVPDISWRNVEQIRCDVPYGLNILGLQRETTLSSPLAIMERRYDVLNAASGSQFCPYTDQDVFGRLGAYSHFSSFAGDVFSSLTVGATISTSETDDTTDGCKWEYETLLFLQNQYRQSYNKLHLPAKRETPKHGGEFHSASSQVLPVDDTELSTERSVTTPDFDKQVLANDEIARAKTSSTYVGHLAKLPTSAGGDPSQDIQFSQSQNVELQSPHLLKESRGSSDSTSGAHERDVFAEFSSVSHYLDTWDRDLLNLDTDLVPIPDKDFFETMVSKLLQDSDQEDTHRSPFCCSQDDLSRNNPYTDSRVSERQTSICLVISHPHGGPKMLSVGFFSRHGHVGGILYDTPTCMGSCGAPVVALTEGVESPYLTHFVHSGTVKVNGVPVGAGVAYFDSCSSLY